MQVKKLQEKKINFFYFFFVGKMFMNNYKPTFDPSFAILLFHSVAHSGVLMITINYVIIIL